MCTSRIILLFFIIDVYVHPLQVSRGKLKISILGTGGFAGADKIVFLLEK